jgi:hypothetical protein
VLFGVLLVNCSDGTGPDPDPPLDCSVESTRSLAVGEHQILNPRETGACVRLPAAGPEGAEHLYIALATEGQESPNGVSAPYLMSGVSAATAAPPALPAPVLSAFQRPLAPQAFHAMLRAREKSLAGNLSRALFSQGQLRDGETAPPVVGEERPFNVCSSTTCNEFVTATATARAVGERVAIFVDNAAPAGGYNDSDLNNVRNLFDQHLYRIDTTAFGTESDVDGNDVVIVLLTQRVNALSPDCNTSGRIILGYFFGADLMPPDPDDNPGSNYGEIFYGLVPDPDNDGCSVSKGEATSRLPATFIHEFQHMISYNQHVLLRQGSAEDTWLNEGLSHLAEELGARLVPDAQCPTSSSCDAEFLGQGNLLNAFEYLASIEDFFLIEPGNSTGKLQERGANWLFVRWLADHFAADTILGTEITRALVATNQTGSANVTARTGVDFSTLVSEWQLTNYLDDLPGFSAPGSRLRYKSWNFRSAAEENGGFPLVPERTDGTAYGHSGTLRAGSGHHVLVAQSPGAAGVDLRLTGSAGSALPNSIAPRIALVRIR